MEGGQRLRRICPCEHLLKAPSSNHFRAPLADCGGLEPLPCCCRL
jgi:hypothetical protein